MRTPVTWRGSNSSLLGRSPAAYSAGRSILRDDNSSFDELDLTNPDVYRNGRIVLPKAHALHIRFSHDLPCWRGTAYQRISVQNHKRKSGKPSIWTLLFA